MPDVTGKRVLIVGDSLSASSAAPGGVLAQNLRGAAEVLINAKVGRSAKSFWSEGALLVPAGFQPDVAIVVLGTNDIVVGAGSDATAMTRIRNDLAGTGAEVWAFGPPAFAPGHRLELGQPGVVDMMEDVFGSRFIDLRPITADLVGAGQRTSDGIHFPASTGKVAGERMAKAFLEAGGGMGWTIGLLAATVIGYLLLR